MTFRTYKGRITVLGDSVSSANASLGQNTYSYIEFEGGEIIRRLKTLMGLDGHLKAGYKEDEIVELHVNEILTGVPDPGSVLMAMRRANGRLYASHIPDLPFNIRMMPTFLFFIGLFTIWIFGIGLIFWFLAWKMRKSLKMVTGTKNYIKSLNGAIEI